MECSSDAPGLLFGPFQLRLSLIMIFIVLVSGATTGLARGGFRGTSYPGPGLGGPGLSGPGRVQVSALSFGVAPSGGFMGLKSLNLILGN